MKYGSKDKGKDKSSGREDVGSVTLSSKRPWSPPDGSPDAPGESKKIPHDN